MKYEYGVVYVTNGKKPDLPDDVLVQIYTEDASSGWGQREKVGYWQWESPLITKFRIMDERYKPKPKERNVLIHKGNHNPSEIPHGEYKIGHLPKIGAELEYVKKGSAEEKWWKCKVIAHDDGAPVVKMESGRYHRRSLDDYKFRPLQSERDVLVERAKSDFMKTNVGSYTNYEERCIEALIDAGYRKIKQQTEDEFVSNACTGYVQSQDMARAIYRVGCRFIEVSDE